MAKKQGKREMPEMNTSSLPDLIFTILFFFMIVTTMREVTLKVKFTVLRVVHLCWSSHRPAPRTDG